MLAPMSLAQPSKAWRFATFATVASVLGGVLGYLLGFWLFEPVVEPLIAQMGWQEKFNIALNWFKEYGVWVVFLAGFSPIPYKVFTIGAGLLHMAFLPFLLASAVGRGARFFLVSALMKWGGVKMEQKLRQYVEALGWGLVILVVVAYFLLR
eukprot:TRINITY_DN1494_c0_g1_i3.p1 TRINITY_DN1494_c0_g1~~TRINITY_DN1494_c0_g1_i3.p1  ORF type:complete len:152 (-),score=36.33 TRINITY_DN1494_c0_g1_i3:414-869(-)